MDASRPTTLLTSGSIAPTLSFISHSRLLCEDRIPIMSHFRSCFVQAHPIPSLLPNALCIQPHDPLVALPSPFIFNIHMINQGFNLTLHVNTWLVMRALHFPEARLHCPHTLRSSLSRLQKARSINLIDLLPTVDYRRTRLVVRLRWDGGLKDIIAGTNRGFEGDPPTSAPLLRA
ncbi:uncharacterized protein EI90DRAFT_283378 [Cantharellus anzutake]|uniref:uncharacterized protein n=1 Tax=Cantharellus anzutake TaxID=1750568 RepID=UPI00190747F9|nr:uncharacterized protein EI90DRAFT_283378 [Cantharellus anzutake]KAF8335978.1 hypothetical protein EI90DRAFT_283378 [Cantharellus anzutake]